MTKLEELKAAYDATCDAAEAARDEAHVAYGAAYCAAVEARDYADYAADAADYAACDAARDAYQAELKKTKEQTND